MASTTTLPHTLAQALAECDPNELADALRRYGLGMHLSPMKVTFAALTAAAAIDITTAAALAAATLGAKTPALPQGQATLPPILSVVSCRVTAGAAAAGDRHISDAGGTPTAPADTGPGIATLSDDGKTLTFENTVTAFVLEYIPRSAVDVTTTFERS